MVEPFTARLGGEAKADSGASPEQATPNDGSENVNVPGPLVRVPRAVGVRVPSWAIEAGKVLVQSSATVALVCPSSPGMLVALKLPVPENSTVTGASATEAAGTARRATATTITVRARRVTRRTYSRPGRREIRSATYLRG